MKLLATVSALALTVALASQVQAADLPAPAPEPALPYISAVMSMWAGVAALDSSYNGESSSSCGRQSCSFDASSYFTFGGDARVAGRNWQFDINAATIGETDTADSDEYSQYIALGGHWLNRGPDRTWGIFGGVTATGHQEADDSSYHLFAGVEYAKFYGQSTWFGQVGGIFAIAGEDSSTWESGPFGRIGWRYFPTEMSKIELDVMAGYGKFNYCSDCSGSKSNQWTWAWGAEYESQISGGPFAWFAGYRGQYFKRSTRNKNSANDHVFRIGFRVDVNSDTLRQRDVNGAGTFDLPDFHRALAWPDEL
jgi:hypothetical protein